MRTLFAAAVMTLSFVVPGTALAAVQVGQPFPSDLFTTQDRTQLTGLRVDLPKPDCAVRPSDCADVDVLNTLDGFNIQPRISIPFSGPIDVSTVSSETVFLVGPHRQRVGINQVVWEPAANTLHVESDAQLAPDSRYLLIVTRRVRGADGQPLDASDFWHHRAGHAPTGTKAYRTQLMLAVGASIFAGSDPAQVAGASVFTTQSIAAVSKKVRRQIRKTPAPAPNFTLGNGGERTVFPLASITTIQWTRQTGTSTFANSFLPTPVLSLFPGSVSTVAFGSYPSADYETAGKVIPAVGTKKGTPEPQGTNQIQFTLFVPAGTKPDDGWPVAIFGHGFTDSKNGAPWAVASSLAHSGIATIAINVVGHGGGPLGSYTVLRPGSAPVALPAGGRGIDQDGNGTIDSTEGVNAAAPQALVGNRDGLRQTVFDLIQLVQVLKRGVDVDGDGGADLERSRIYYAGQSFGGIYGVPFLGLERKLRAGVPNVPGGPIIEIARLSPSFRPLVGISLISRVPSLYNAAPNPTLTSFVENKPLRNLPPVVDTVPGASAIQQYLDRAEWAQQAANPAAYAPLIRRPFLLQFARGDQTVPNPTTSAIIRAGDLASRTTLFRNDLAFRANPAVGRNPHTFLTNVANPAVAPYALAAQAQIAAFFASDGASVIDPDGVAGPIFETPMVGPPPEDLAFIP